MDDQLLPDILAAEREIRRQIDILEVELAERLQRVKKELEENEENESRNLQTELEQACSRTDAAAQQEAEALLTAAQLFAQKLDNLDQDVVDQVVMRHLPRIMPEGANDCQDEQT